MDAATEAAKFAAIVKANTSWRVRLGRRLTTGPWLYVTTALMVLFVDITRAVILTAMVYIVHEHWIAAMPTIRIWWALALVWGYNMFRSMYGSNR